MFDVYSKISELGVPELLKSKNGKKISSVADFEKRREEIKDILQYNEYGYIPEAPEHLKVRILSEDYRFSAGKGCLQSLEFTVTVNGEDFVFPVSAVIPVKEGVYPAFLHINFRPDVPDKYMPSEEILDSGFAVFSFCYKDITSDDDNFKDKIASYFIKGKRELSSPGKIAMWAWAAMRVMDYIQTLDYIDKDNIAVCGHSRLGKTALVTGGFDERFKYVISSNSGCCGASISRGKIGETVTVLSKLGSRWFCPRFPACYSGREEEMPFDQHFLLALSVPRHILVGSAAEDTWADPHSEFYSLALVNEAYALYGMRGLVYDDFPKPDRKSVV